MHPLNLSTPEIVCLVGPDDSGDSKKAHYFLQVEFEISQHTGGGSKLSFIASWPSVSSVVSAIGSRQTGHITVELSPGKLSCGFLLLGSR